MDSGCRLYRSQHTTDGCIPIPGRLTLTTSACLLCPTIVCRENKPTDHLRLVSPRVMEVRGFSGGKWVDQKINKMQVNGSNIDDSFFKSMGSNCVIKSL